MNNTSISWTEMSGTLSRAAIMPVLKSVTTAMLRLWPNASKLWAIRATAKASR